RLAPEPLAAVLAEAQLWIEELDGDLTAEPQAVAAEDQAHPALADLLAPLDLSRQHARRRRLLADEARCVRVIVEAPARPVIIVVAVVATVIDVLIDNDFRDRVRDRSFVIVSISWREHGHRRLGADGTISRRSKPSHAHTGLGE